MVFPHQIPHYYFGHMWVCQNCDSDVCIYQWTLFTQAEAEDLCGGAVELSSEGWWVHLDSRGYLDQTDWQGPYDEEPEARRAAVDVWGVHPTSGESSDGSDQDAFGDRIFEAAREHPLTDEDFPETERRYAKRVDERRKRMRAAGVATPPKHKKTEYDRMADFFFGPRRRR